MQVSIEYPSQPKTVVLTPTRQKFGSLVARGSKVAIADECMKIKDLKVAVINKVGKMIREEVWVLCSNKSHSILKSTDPKILKKFNCDSVITEMEKYTPTLLRILKECTKPLKARKKKTQQKRPQVTSPNNQHAVIAMCTAILCKNRRPSMCLVQKMISLILQAGRASKQVHVQYIVVTCAIKYYRFE